MKRWIGCAAGISFLVLCGLGTAAGQHGPATSFGVTVVHDAAHGVTPALSKVHPIPPAKGLERIMPLLLTHSQKPRLFKQDPLLQQSTPNPSQAAPSGLGFPGIGVGLGSFSVQYIPPDTNGAAGPTQYVQWVNASYAVFNKFTGAVELGPYAGNMLWESLGGACSSNNSGDPIAQFDKQAGRWVLMQPVFKSPYYMCVAVSQTADATGGYYTYAFPVPSGDYFPDYPKLAVWSDGYYISFNSFKGNTYLGPAACVMDRSAMLNGQSASMACTPPQGRGYSPLLPADLDGDITGVSGTSSAPPSGEADYYLNFGSGSLNVWQFSPNHSTFSLKQSFSVPSFSEACGGGACIPQLGTSESLDSLGDRMMYRLGYRNIGGNEYLVANQSVDAAGTQVGIRWYELENSGSGFTIAQAGTFAPADGNDRWMGSIAMDEAQDIALGYSESSSLMNPAIAFTGTTPSDGGLMETEKSIILGSGSQTQYNRWGDYSSMSVDPTDDCTLWYTNEYLQSTGVFNWSTQITPIRFSPCPTLAFDAEPPSQTVNAGSSTSYALAVTPSGGSPGSTSFSVVSGLPANSSASFSTPTASGSSASSTLTVNTNVGGTTPNGTYTLSVSASDGGVKNVSRVVLTVNGAVVLPTVSSVSLSSYNVTGGTLLTGTVTLSSAAPSGGASVSLQSSNTAAATVPSSVTVPAGSTSTTFQVTTLSVTSSSQTTITASYNNSSQGAILAVNPPPPGFSLSASPSSFSLKQGASNSSTITVSSTGGFNGTVGLAATVSPAGAGVTVSPQSTSISGGSGSYILTVSASSTATTGNYAVTVTGSSTGYNSSTASIAVTVTNSHHGKKTNH